LFLRFRTKLKEAAVALWYKLEYVGRVMLHAANVVGNAMSIFFSRLTIKKIRKLFTKKKNKRRLTHLASWGDIPVYETYDLRRWNPQALAEQIDERHVDIVLSAWEQRQIPQTEDKQVEEEEPYL